MLENLSFCRERKDLLKQLVMSKLVASQKDMLLGYVWWILDPLLLMLVYWFLVGIIFKRGGPDYPLFVLCGLVPFRAFAVSFSQSVTSIAGKFGLISQINFPRVFLPLSDVLSNHVKLIFGFLVVIVTALVFCIRIDHRILLLLIPFVMQILLVSGLAMFTSVLGVYFRDLQNLVQFLMRIFLYFSPVLYSVERIPERFRDLYFILNPIAPLLVTYRAVIMQNKALDYHLVGISAGHAIVFVLAGYVFFVFHDKKLLKRI